MSKHIDFQKRSWDDYLYWQSTDKKILKRINEIIKDISRNRHNGLGKPEALKGEFSGWWSRRIDEKHRLVYRIIDDIIEIVSCRGHYDDK